jgi:hypothetical protein
MAITELAWQGYTGKVKVKLKPSLRKMFEHRKALTKALYELQSWYGSSSHVNIKKFEDAVMPVAALFGYDPYIGPVFRAIPVVKGLKSKKLFEGSIRRLKSATRPISSWTTSLSNASNYAVGEYNGDFAVIMLVDKGYQLMSTVYLEAVCRYILTVCSSKVLSRIRKGIRQKYKGKSQLDEKESLEDQLNELEDLEGHAADTLRSTQSFKHEDEIIMRLKPRSKVQIKLVNDGRRVVRRK